MIVDGRAFWICDLAGWRERVAVEIARKRKLTVRSLDDIAPDADPAPVCVNLGRFFGRCPCGGVELVWIDQPQLWCTSCGNADLGGKWRPVLMPPRKFLDAVFSILSLRPEHQRTWAATETLHQLVAEAKALKLPVPDDLGELATNDEPYSAWLLFETTSDRKAS